MKYVLQHTGFKVFPDDTVSEKSWKEVDEFNTLEEARKNITECNDYYRVLKVNGGCVISTLFPSGL